MGLRHRLDKLEGLTPSRVFRSLIQIVGEDGIAKPTDAEVEVWRTEVEAEGVEPFVIRISCTGPAWRVRRGRRGVRGRGGVKTGSRHLDGNTEVLTLYLFSPKASHGVIHAA